MKLSQQEDLIIQGPIIHSVSRDKIEFFENALIQVKGGKIVSLDVSGGQDPSKMTGRVIKLTQGQFLCPGFIDLHIHAPQYPNIGLGLDLPLLEWLTRYTFPLETKYSDIEFADTVYRYAVRTSICCGTTTAVYYGTIHGESTLRLGQIISELGQRAILGKVAMNRNCPDTYVEDTEQSYQGTVKFVNAINELNNPLVMPAVTPRFAISCDNELLKSLAEFATQKNLYIQTHISENKSEVEFVKELFPNCIDYMDVYDKAGLLTNKTILAHGIYLSDREMEVMHERGTCIAHCPNSNTYLQSGLCDVRKLWKHNVKVGLGTDVSGGCNASILDAMRCALATSAHISFQDETHKPINYQEAFYLATLGSATALGMEDKIGNFEVGKDFDALLVDMKVLEANVGALPDHTLQELVQKFIYCGDSRNVKDVYIQGRLAKTES